MGGAANKKDVRTSLLGILVLALGILMLMTRAGVLDLNFGRIIGLLVLVTGGLEAITGFDSSNHGTLFWGSSLFLAGLLMILASYNFVPGTWDQIWPVALIIPGLSFLMLYFSNVREYRLLVCAVLLVGVGWIGMLIVKDNYSFSDYLLGRWHFFVPMAIVLTGFYLVWKNLFRPKP
jgi:hypothetical protein